MLDLQYLNEIKVHKGKEASIELICHCEKPDDHYETDHGGPCKMKHHNIELLFTGDMER
jgi:hypothetical protein